MDRQLFSQTSRVSTRGHGAVPVSMALHAVAIGAAVLVSAAMTPPLPAVEEPRVSIPVILPSPPVRVMPPPPPPKGLSSGPARTGPPRTAATPPPPTTAVAPSPDLRNVASIETIIDDTPVHFGAGPGGATDCTVGCSGEIPGDERGVVGGDGPVRVHTGIDAPTRIHFVRPTYPPVAITARIQGEVTIDCVIGPDGKVYEARVLSGNLLLRQAALDAVRQWRYTRPRMNDTAISVLLMVKVDFQLR